MYPIQVPNPGPLFKFLGFLKFPCGSLEFLKIPWGILRVPKDPLEVSYGFFRGSLEFLIVVVNSHKTS